MESPIISLLGKEPLHTMRLSLTRKNSGVLHLYLQVYQQRSYQHSGLGEYSAVFSNSKPQK